MVQYVFTSENDTAPNVQVFRYPELAQNVAAAGTQNKILYAGGAISTGHTDAIYQFAPSSAAPLAAPVVTLYTPCRLPSAYSAASAASAGNWIVFSGGTYAILSCACCVDGHCSGWCTLERFLGATLCLRSAGVYTVAVQPYRLLGSARRQGAPWL